MNTYEEDLQYERKTKIKSSEDFRRKLEYYFGISATSR